MSRGRIKFVSAHWNFGNELPEAEAVEIVRAVHKEWGDMLGQDLTMENPRRKDHNIHSLSLEKTMELFEEACRAYDGHGVAIECFPKGGYRPAVSYLYFQVSYYYEYVKTKYALGLELDPTDMTPERYEQLMDCFLRVSRNSAAIYGYCQVLDGRRDKGSMHFVHQGPSRLEWANWFSPEYTDVFRQEGLAAVPFEKVDVGGREYLYLRLGESPWKYIDRATRRREWEYRRSLGLECFSRWPSLADRIFHRLFVNPSVLSTGPKPKLAKKVPRIDPPPGGITDLRSEEAGAADEKPAGTSTGGVSEAAEKPEVEGGVLKRMARWLCPENPKTPEKYDDWDWHEMPDDVPEDNAITHTGMFVAWAVLRGLESEYFRGESGEALEKVRRREITGRRFLFDEWDGKFFEDYLTDEGNAFAKAYYLRDYIEDYTGTFGDEAKPTLYSVEDTWENFDRIAPVIDRRYEKWKAGR